MNRKYIGDVIRKHRHIGGVFVCTRRVKMITLLNTLFSEKGELFAIGQGRRVC